MRQELSQALHILLQPPERSRTPSPLPLPLQGTGWAPSLASLPFHEAGVSLSLLLPLLTQEGAKGTLSFSHCEETAQSSLLAMQGVPEGKEQTKTPLYHPNLVCDRTVLPKEDKEEMNGEL